MKPQRVPPSVHALTQPFWDAAAQHRLVVQRCGACGSWQHPPAMRCQRCARTDMLGFEPVVGAASLVTWTEVRQGLVHGFKDSVPYLNLVVELEEQPGVMMLSDTAGSPLAGWTLCAGERMQVWFEDCEGFTLPQFRPTALEAGGVR